MNISITNLFSSILEASFIPNVLIAKVTEIPRLWYAVPLIIAVSLVYGATRHEHLKEIAIQSFKSLFWVTGFMAVIWGIIFVAGYWN